MRDTETVFQEAVQRCGDSKRCESEVRQEHVLRLKMVLFHDVCPMYGNKCRDKARRSLSPTHSVSPQQIYAHVDTARQRSRKFL